MAFVVVYIREAHATDGWSIEQSGWSIIEDPTSDDERRAAAAQACSVLRFPFPVAVDTMDDDVAQRWSAWPERLFFVDIDGIVRYVGEQGPFGFWPREETPPYVPAGEEFSQGEPLDTFLASFVDQPVTDDGAAPIRRPG